VLKNFKLLRDTLDCHGDTEDETRYNVVNTSNKVRTQLRALTPELVQLYSSKPASRDFSNHDAATFGEAWCAAKYKSEYDEEAQQVADL
jgi:hypothetical protein